MKAISSRALLLVSLLALAACGAVRVEPQTALPPPLIDKQPVTVGVHFPAEFREYIHREQRHQVEYEAVLGPAHVVKLRRLLEAMFETVVEVDDPARALEADAAVRMVLEPRFEDYAFLTPNDAAGDSYTVTIRYRFDLYSPRGERVDRYVVTGYGREKAGAMAGYAPLVKATQRAMRDAGAQLAVELPSQEAVQRLLAGQAVEPRRDEPGDLGDALGAFGEPAKALEATPTGPAGEPPGEQPDEQPVEQPLPPDA